jgi:hypothetical protein
MRRYNSVTVYRVFTAASDSKDTIGLDAIHGSADKTNSCHAVVGWRCWFYLWIPVDAGIHSISPLLWHSADHHFKTLLLLLLSRFTFQIIACSGTHSQNIPVTPASQKTVQRRSWSLALNRMETREVSIWGRQIQWYLGKFVTKWTRSWTEKINQTALLFSEANLLFALFICYY